MKAAHSVPPAYDACWPTGASLHGDFDWVEGDIAILQNTISNPKAYDNSGYEGIIKLGLKPIQGLRTGASFAYGPWIGTAEENFPDKVLSYMQTASGIYFEYSFGHWQFFSEVMEIEWETPYVYEGSVSLMTGYGEFRWNMIPGWYIGGRFDFMQYDKISTTNAGSGTKETWGYDFNRVEMAVGYRIIREGYMRINYQSTLFRSKEKNADDENILALQFFFNF